MKAVITDETVQVYGSTEDQSISIATLHKAQVVELGKVIRKKQKVFVEVKLSEDQTGYIDGETKIFAIKKGQVSSTSVDLLDAPAANANVVKVEMRGALLELNGVEKNDDGTWFSVVDESGVTGFITGNAKLRAVPEASRSSAIRNIVYGAVFIVLGVIFTVLNQKSQANNSMEYITIAVIFFGLLQGGQGVVELTKVKKKEAAEKKPTA